MRSSDSCVATEEQVRNVPVPAATRTFQPVRNGELLDMVMKVSDTFGLKLSNGRFALATEQQRMFGTYDLIGQNIEDIASFQVGVRNSCDKSLAAGICFGTRVFVCSNLAFVGYADDMFGITGRISHRHTSHILKEERLYNRLLSSFEQFNDFRDWQVKFFDKVRDTNLNNGKAYETIIDAARANVINKTDIIDVADEWEWQDKGQDKPIEDRVWHSEFKPRTAYSLMNAFTEVGKAFQKKNPVGYPQRTMSLVKFLGQRYQLN